MKISFGKLLIVFTVIPFVELYSLLIIAENTSATTTLLLIIITGIIGAYYAKKQGTQVINAIKVEWNSGRVPKDELMHGLCVLIGGVLLLTPGILTDIFGFSLLIPSTRILYIDKANKIIVDKINRY